MENALLVTCFQISFVFFFLAETYNEEGTLVFACCTVHMTLRASIHAILSLSVRAFIFDQPTLHVLYS